MATPPFTAAVPSDVNPSKKRTRPVAGAGLTFRFDLSLSREVTAVVFDVSGKRVRGLLERQSLPAGAQTLAWDGEDDAHLRVPPGIYWISLRAGADEGRRRAVILE